MNDVRAGSQAKRRRTRTKANPPTRKRPRCGRERTSPRRSSRTTAAQLCTCAPSWRREWLSSVCASSCAGGPPRVALPGSTAIALERSIQIAAAARDVVRAGCEPWAEPPLDRRPPGPGPATARPRSARRRLSTRHAGGAMDSGKSPAPRALAPRARERVSWFSPGVAGVTARARRLWRPGRQGSGTPVGRRHDSAVPGPPACAAWPASRRCARRALRHARWPGA